MKEWKLPLLTDYIKKWATITPNNPALVSTDTGQTYTFKEFDEMITLYALQLKKMGLKKGDVVVSQVGLAGIFYADLCLCNHWRHHDSARRSLDAT